MKNTGNIISMIAAISIAMCAVSCGDGSAASSGRSAGTAGGSAKASAGVTEAERADKTDAGDAEAAMEAEDGVYEGETGELAGDAGDVKKSAVEGEGGAQTNSAMPEAGQLTARQRQLGLPHESRKFGHDQLPELRHRPARKSCSYREKRVGRGGGERCR